MADERDPKVSQRYRELGSEEPSRELDQAILSAARRAADKPHAPLVAPSGRHRWYFSLGAAAVIVLAVAVTYHMQQEAPDPDSVAVPAAPEERRIDAAQDAPPVFVPDAKPQGQERQRELAREAPSARSEVAGAAQRDAARVPSQPRPMQAQQLETPERMLERIVELRKDGKHEEADRMLAEFRRRYPDYRLSDAMLGKVEKK